MKNVLSNNKVVS